MKKSYVSPSIMLLAGVDPGGDPHSYDPGKDPSLGAKQGEFDDFDDFDKDKFSQW